MKFEDKLCNESGNGRNKMDYLLFCPLEIQLDILNSTFCYFVYVVMSLKLKTALIILI